MATPTHTQLARAANAALKPEWMRLPTAVVYSGIGRSSLYALIGENHIRSAVVKKRGNIMGIRLVSVSSLDDYLNKLADANAPAEPATVTQTR